MLKFTTQNTRQSQCIVGTVYFSKSRNNAIPNIAIHDIPTSSQIIWGPSRLGQDPETHGKLVEILLH